MSDTDKDEQWDELKRSYAKYLVRSVDLPQWAANSFTSEGLVVLGVIRDTAYYSSDGACSLAVSEIAKLAGVSARTAIRTITVAIAAGIVVLDGCNLLNRHVQYKTVERSF